MNAGEMSELRKISLRAEFGDASAADRFGPQMEAELSAVNEDVDRELGGDFVRYFAAGPVSDRLRGLDLPVLVIHGDADPRPVSASGVLAGLLPRRSMAVLPEAFRELVRGFLAGSP